MPVMAILLVILLQPEAEIQRPLSGETLIIMAVHMMNVLPVVLLTLMVIVRNADTLILIRGGLEKITSEIRFDM